jgi:hypothetical protein
VPALAPESAIDVVDVALVAFPPPIEGDVEVDAPADVDIDVAVHSPVEGDIDVPSPTLFVTEPVDPDAVPPPMAYTVVLDVLAELPSGAGSAKP